MASHIVVNNTHDIEEGDKHYLDLCFRHANLFGREDAGAFTALPFDFRIILKALHFIFIDNF